MLDIIKEFFTAEFLFIVIRVGVPLLYASMSAYVASLAGIPNIAVEGIMIFGALFGVYFSAIFASSWLGLLGVIVLGVLIAFLLAAVISIALLASKKKKTDEYIPFGPFIVIAAFIVMIVPFDILLFCLLKIFTLGMYQGVV